MSEDRIYLLEDTECHVEVFRLDTSSLVVHAPAVISVEAARQLAHGILAVLSDQFDKAVSESTLVWDLSRRTRSSRESVTSVPTHRPTLENL